MKSGRADQGRQKQDDETGGLANTGGHFVKPFLQYIVEPECRLQTLGLAS